MLMHRSVGCRSVRGVLDEGDDPAGHEAGGAYRRPRPGDLGYLHHPAHGADVDAPPGPRGAHFIGPGPVPGVDHDLDAVPFHGAPLPMSQRTYQDIPPSQPEKHPRPPAPLAPLPLRESCPPECLPAADPARPAAAREVTVETFFVAII